MIRIKAVINDSGLFALTVDGHEDLGSGHGGKVCAAITAITQTALLGLQAYAGEYPSTVTLEIQESS